MTMGEVVRLLRSEGFDVNRHRIWHMVQIDRVDRPRKDGAHNFIFADAHLSQIREYLENPPHRGAKPQPKPEAAAV